MNSKDLLCKLVVVVSVAFGSISCTSQPQIVGPIESVHAAPDLGIMTDENFKVVDLLRPGPAQEAGVQVGDVLLDLTWIPSDARVYLPETTDTLYIDKDGFVVDPVGNPYVDATGRRLTADDMLGAAGPPRSVDAAPEESDSVAKPTARPTLVPPITIDVQPGSPPYSRPVGPPAAEVIEKESVPFSAENEGRIRGMAAYGVPLKLRVQRGDEVLELTITPTAPASRYVEPAPDAPTPTPISSAYYF